MPSEPSGATAEKPEPTGQTAAGGPAVPPGSGPAVPPTSGPGPGRSIRWPVLLTGLGAAALLAVMVAVVGLIGGLAPSRSGQAAPGGQWQEPAGAQSGPTADPTTAPSAAPTAAPPSPVISLSATGDIILGDAGRLPPHDGAGFFDHVAEALAADLVMGNLEQPLTGDTGFEKCPEDSTACHAFRAPTHYAKHLADAGFQLMNLANNHGNDYGPQGRMNTQATLTDHGIAHTGERDQITVMDVQGIAVAVVGFSPYAWTNDLNDHVQAADVVSRAARQADLVVVQVHMGAEGSDQTRVRPGPEEYFGENRGDPMAFSRAVVDAGADLVVGHGPHVLRGMEFYRGRLIAYSLGNFAGGGGTLNSAGNLGLGAVLKVSLRADGSFASGELISTHMYEGGLPRLDPQARSLGLVRDITERDFPTTGALLGPAGEINEPGG